MKRSFALVFVVVGCGAVLGLGACKDRAVPGGAKKDPEYAQKNLLSTAPTPKAAVNADFGGKVVYLGNDVEKTALKPGEKFTITHYWKVVQPPGDDYAIFTHVRGSGGEWMNVDLTKMRTSYPLGDWKAGDIIRDEQTITLKNDWKSPVATVNIGIYKRGGHSENDRLAIVSGPDDGHRGIIAARFTVGGSGTKMEVAHPMGGGPDYVVHRASGPITIDGKADEADWASAVSTGNFKDAEGTSAPVPPTTAKMLWDDKNLYVFIDVTDTDVFSEYKRPDDPLWKEDTVELFIDADKNGHGYVELQVNPNNAQFDSWFQTTRAQPGDEKWTSGIVSAVVVDGTADNRSDTDKGWHAEIAIPLAAVKGKDDAMAVTIPPKVGDSWKLNIVRVEKAKDAKQITASAWAQISMADFHAIDKLLTVTFGDEKGAIAAAAPAPAAPAPGAPAPAPTEAKNEAPATGAAKVKGMKIDPKAVAPAPKKSAHP
jgi:hypothetical protein